MPGPPISRFMTTQLWTVEAEASIAAARALMITHRIRHLPVVVGRHLVGILSERDIHLAQLSHSEAGSLSVEETVSSPAYVLRPDEPVETIVDTMASRRYSAAVVVNGRGEVQGIFTTVDALRALAAIVRDAVKARSHPLRRSAARAQGSRVFPGRRLRTINTSIAPCRFFKPSQPRSRASTAIASRCCSRSSRLVDTLVETSAITSSTRNTSCFRR